MIEMTSPKVHSSAQLTLLKYSTHDCPACQGMASFDASVAMSMGLSFVDVDMKSPEIYGHYRKILLQQYPLKRELGLPTYLLVENPEGEFVFHGEIFSGMPEPAFRDKLRLLLEEGVVPQRGDDTCD